MRYVLRKSHPPVSRILLVESGSRGLIEHIIPLLYRIYGDQVPIDLVTCFGGLPAWLPPESTRVYRVTEFRTKPMRQRLIQELRAAKPSIVAIICSGEPIMTKWKWVLAFRLPAKVMVVNENGDFFWLDRGHWRVFLEFVCVRAGLTGGNAAPELLRLAIFPLTLTYLLFYAAFIHLRRKALT